MVMSSDGKFRLGCDVGGTFTDFVLYDEASGQIHIDKQLTTPSDPSVGILNGLKGFSRVTEDHVARTRLVAHATTLVANAVIERKGAVTALLTTKGFRDVLELRRHVRVTTYELWSDPPRPLVPRALRLPIDERTYSDGSTPRLVRREEIANAVEVMRAAGVEAVAVAFLHSYVNARNEREAGRLLAELAPEIAVTLSCDVLPQIKEYERTSTTVVNGYVKPLARGYLKNLDAGLGAVGYTAPLRIMLSNGGLGSAEIAAEFPLRLIESGPVAGAIVGRQIAQALEIPELLSFDMGGTTAKACLIRDGALPITDELEVARSKRFTKSSGFPVAVPAVNMIEIGAGGGSIAAINSMGLVQVGPESAGADPGPICYGGGGIEPTVTDADLTLGYLNAGYFADGSMALDAEAARAGISGTLAGPRDQSEIEAAWTVHDVVNETMAGAVRMHVTERGGNPQLATLVAFGGAGPVHAYNLAAKLRISRVMVPLRAGVLSALGLLVAPPAYDMVRTHKAPLEAFDAADTGAIMAEMEEAISKLLEGLGSEGGPRFSRGIDVGYIGQSYQVTVPIDGAPTREEIWARFAEMYREKYGYFYDDVPAETVNLRVLGERVGGELELQELPSNNVVEAEPSGRRPAYSALRREMVSFDVHDRTALRPGMCFKGPAVVEEASATTVVDEGGWVEVDRHGSLVITLNQEDRP
jgi:N-methylhydantoinase A